MRESYGSQVERPHLDRWERGEPDEIEWLKPWFDTVRGGVAAGKVFRRVRIVSEPITNYIRWEHMDALCSWRQVKTSAGCRGGWSRRSPFPATTSGCSTPRR